MKYNIYGKQGEIIATNYLKKKKYKIIETNYTNKIGEIDIIAKKEDEIVFIEVKSRSSTKFGLPNEAVNITKQNKIHNVALYYLQTKQFIDEKYSKEEIDCLESIHENLLNLSKKHFNDASTYHFDLEKIYSSAVFFEKNEEMLKKIISAIF